MHNSKCAEYQKKTIIHNEKPLCKMHKSLHLLLHCQNTIYLEWKKRYLNRTELGTEELDAQHYAPYTLNCMFVCMYFIACYYELLMLILYEL